MKKTGAIIASIALLCLIGCCNTIKNSYKNDRVADKINDRVADKINDRDAAEIDSTDNSIIDDYDFDFENKNTVIELYKRYKEGTISECYYNGERVYSAGINAHDAGSTIYDSNGNPIGRCIYGWGRPDSICFELKDCEVIYRVKNNLQGRPAVDKYGLNRIKNTE